MNTQENNKMIAEFMQLPTEIFQPRGIINYGIDDSWYEEHELSYHLSWNWLIPVVENCLERLDAIDNSANEIKRQLLVCNLRGVHTAVVEFIKQYNKNQ
tara:strand:- start:10936 stop:11232 length:297 start_codon:yes stop_codon:yes gene_type:complete